jgi:hypothetical protein
MCATIHSYVWTGQWSLAIMYSRYLAFCKCFISFLLTYTHKEKERDFESDSQLTKVVTSNMYSDFETTQDNNVIF